MGANYRLSRQTNPRWLENTEAIEEQLEDETEDNTNK